MNADDPRILAAAARRPWYRLLYAQVLVAIVLGVVLGDLAPGTGAAMKPLGDAFVNLIRMMIAPIIFCTIVHGIAAMGDLRKVGRVGLKALLYFEVVSTLALLIGVVVGDGLSHAVGVADDGEDGISVELLQGRDGADVFVRGDQHRERDPEQRQGE